MKKALFIVTKAPYGREDSFGGILFAGTGVAADVQSTVVFVGDGVHNTVKGQDPSGYIKLGERMLNLPNIEEVIGDLSQTGVKFYALKKDLEARGIDEEELIEDLEIISEDEVAGLMLEADATLVF